jgi:long-subunit acyl-CoA synthetase (AMP-forming)
MSSISLHMRVCPPRERERDEALMRSEVDLVIVDREFLHLLDGFDLRVRRIVDDDSDGLSGEFDAAIRQGLEWDAQHGSRGWEGLHTEAEDEEDVIALAYTSGTTAKPKVCPSPPPGISPG